MEEGNSYTPFSRKHLDPTASAGQDLSDWLHSEQSLPWEQGTRKRHLGLQRETEFFFSPFTLAIII